MGKDRLGWWLGSAICDPPCMRGSYCLEPGVCACEPGREAKCALREEAVAISLAKLERKCLRHCRNGGQCFQGHCFCPANTKGRFCQRGNNCKQ
ncbi:hypothetical protein BSL78_13856 [Apostichopus japonicus]|uniref:EGF-like domain-containing protein n=1 Tax=Stichopus japonicus TaxID=307972 RepID=A0A2G8KMJ2_STIJA|nr:hypothetical protein BSL78_13856 [Apostichopus japonicus]